MRRDERCRNLCQRSKLAIAADAAIDIVVEPGSVTSAGFE